MSVGQPAGGSGEGLPGGLGGGFSGGLGGGVGVWHLEEPLGWLAAS